MLRIEDEIGVESFAVSPQIVLSSPSGVVLSDAELVFRGDYSRVGQDLLISGETSPGYLVTGYFSHENPPDLLVEGRGMVAGHTVEALAGPMFPGQYAQAGALAGADVIGSVETLDGSAQVQRTNGITEPLNVGDPVFQGDVVQTGSGSALSIVFVDDTLFSLSADARMVLDELVYSPGGIDNSMVFNLVQGTFVFVTGQVAPTGDMRVETPTATMGIRGTTPVISIDAVNGSTRFSLSADPDGTVGSYQLFDRVSGQLIGTVSSVDASFLVASLGAAPVSVPKSPEEVAAEQAAITQAFTAYRQAGIGQGGGQGEGQGEGNDNADGGEGNGEGDPGQTDAGPQTLPPSNTPNGSQGLGTPPVAPLNSTPNGGEGNGAGQQNGDNSGLDLLDPGAPNPPPQQQGSSSSDTTPQVTETETLDEDLALNLPETAIQTNEDQSITITGLDVAVPGGGDVSVTLEASSTVTLSTTAGLTFVEGDGVDDKTVTFIGSQEAVNAALAGLQYNPTPDAESGDIKVTLFDGNEFVVVTVPIEITPVADAPEVYDISLNVSEGQSVTSPFLGYDPDTGDTIALNSITAPALGFVTVSDDGSFTFNTGGDFDWLAAGETTNVDFRYDGIDSTGLVSETPAIVRVSVTGVNDAPVVITPFLGYIAEDEQSFVQSLLEGAYDPDAGETETLTITDLSALPPSVSLLPDGETLYVDMSHESIQGLAAFEQLELSGTYNVTDVNGASTANQATLIVVGQNDNVTITSADTSGEIFDLPVSFTSQQQVATFVAVDTSTQSANGTIAFEDIDVSDSHYASYIPLGLGYSLGSFSVTQPTTTNTTTTGSINWTFSISDTELDSLASGEVITQDYEIWISDSYGGMATETVTITLHGANDAPSVSQFGSSLTGTVIEQADGDMGVVDYGAPMATGLVSATDPDSGAVLTYTGTAVGIYGDFTIDPQTGVWTYNLDNYGEATDILTSTDVVQETFTVTITDEYAASVTQDVVVTIYGVDDYYFDSGVTGSYILEDFDSGFGFFQGVSAVTQFVDGDPVDQAAVMSTGSVMDNQADVANNLDMTTAEFSTNFGTNTTGGASISTFEYFEAGDIITFDYRFTTSDPAGPDDFAVVVLGDQVVQLSSVSELNVLGPGVTTTGWQTISIDVLATDYTTLGFAVLDVTDYVGSATLEINNIQVDYGYGDVGPIFGSFTVNDVTAPNILSMPTDGADVITGDDLANILDGGLGADTLTGNGGADTFVLSHTDAADIITDFVPSEDRLDISALLDGNFTEANQQDYVDVVNVDGSAQVHVDVDGAGTTEGFVHVATLQGVDAAAIIDFVFNAGANSETQTPIV